MRFVGRGGRLHPDRRWRRLTGTDDFVGNPLTSDPVRYARNMAVLEEDPTLGIGAPTIAWADTSLAP